MLTSTLMEFQLEFDGASMPMPWLVSLLTACWWLYSLMGLGLSIIAFSSVYAVLYLASVAIGRKRRRRI